MRVIVAGASGVVGRALLPALVARGHQVAGLVRSAAGAQTTAALGAEPLVADALNRDATIAHVVGFRPDALIHQLTAIPADLDMRRFDAAFAPTNQLRTKGTDNLLEAARRAGVRRFVAQSFCGWPFARLGGSVKTEDDPLDPRPPAQLKRTLDAIRHLEGAVSAARDVGGVCLRYGSFYGPGTALSRTGVVVEQLRRRRLPIIGKGGGVWSFLHVADAASATLAALEGDAPGVFNVVDDEPAPVAQWLPELARAVDAKPPFRIPAWLGKLLVPEHLFVMMTDIRGGSNGRFKQAFGWQPAFATWRDGFQRGLG